MNGTLKNLNGYLREARVALQMAAKYGRKYDLRTSEQRRLEELIQGIDSLLSFTSSQA